MFKRFSLSVLFVFLCFVFAQAQLTKGTRFLGFPTGATNSSYRTPLAVYGGIGEAAGLFRDGSNIFAFQFSPQVGSFVSDHLLVGSTLYFNNVSFDFENGQTIVGAIPFARYYFNPASTSGTHFYGEVSLGYLTVLNEDDLNATPFTIGAGVTHMLAPNIALDGFARIEDFDITEDLNRTLIFGAGINILMNRETYFSRKSATPGLQAGTMMVGGTTGSLNFGLDGSDARSFSLEPQFFYFLSPQLAVGSGVLMEFTSGSSGTIDFRSTNLGLSPQVRYYLSSGKRNLWFVSGGLNIDYERDKIEGIIPESTVTETTADFAIGAGLNSFVSSNVALEIGPSIRIDPSDEDVRFGIDIGVQVFLNTSEE